MHPALLAACTAFSPDNRAPHASVIVPAASPGAPALRVSASVGSASSFLLSVELLEAVEAEAAVEEASAPTPLESSSLDPARAMARGKVVPGGVRTAFGALLIGDDGRFALQDSAGRTVVAATSPPALVADDGASGRQGILMPTSGSKTGPGATGRRPCLANGNWGPPYTWDAVDGFFAFAVSPWGYDPDYLHCYPASFDGKPPPHTGSGAPPPRAQDTCTTLAHVVPFPNSSRELPGSPVAAPGGASGDGTPTCCGAYNAEPNCTAWLVDSHVQSGGKALCHLFACVEQWTPVRTRTLALPATLTRTPTLTPSRCRRCPWVAVGTATSLGGWRANAPSCPRPPHPMCTASAGSASAGGWTGTLG